VAQSHNWSSRVTDSVHSVGVSAMVFVGFVVAGCAYIIWAKLDGSAQLYVTFVPIAAMLAYALLITLARRLRLRDDQSGDNLYYMGFLFTLTSLGVSLYQFSATRAAEEIVQNFGIAIGSTIAGIALRVVFNQMRRDPIEVERMMRLELAESARKVRRELDSSVVEFGYFRRSAQQASVDAMNHMTVAFEDHLQKLFAKLEEIAKTVTLPVEAASRKSGAAIGEMSKTFGATLTASAEQFSAEARTLSKQVRTIASSLDAVTTRLNAIQTPDRLIEVRIEPMVHLLAQAVDKMTVQSERQASLAKEALARANAADERSSKLVAALREEFGAATTSNRAALEAAITMIKAAADVLSEIQARSKDSVDALGAMLERTDATMRTFTEALLQSAEETAARTDRLSQTLPAIEAKIQALAIAAERISRMAREAR
jgi:hypothetical protein